MKGEGGGHYILFDTQMESVLIYEILRILAVAQLHWTEPPKYSRRYISAHMFRAAKYEKADSNKTLQDGISC